MTADRKTDQPASDPPQPRPDGRLKALDQWMHANPWHPRAAPFFVYICAMFVGQLITGGAFGLPELTVLNPLIYTLQVGLVVFLLWRYRDLMPELNIKFHWLAVPTGLGLLFAWVYLGYASIAASRALQDIPVASDIATFLVNPDLPISPAEAQQQLKSGDAPAQWIRDERTTYGDAWFWTTMSLRLLGMSLVVPLFEELWVRSAVLRGTFSPSKTKTAIIQLASDLPIIGDRISQTQASRDAMQQPPLFTQQLTTTAVGRISLFAVVMSTLVFMLSHQRRDYLGCIACGLVWCWLVWWTNRPKKGQAWEDQPPGGRYGLGPIVWSHGITNAALWAWTLYTNDWQYL